MKGLQVRYDSRRIARSMVAVAQWHKFSQSEKEEHAKQLNVPCAERFEWSGQEAVPPKIRQNISWNRFFADDAQRRDNGRTKRTSPHPDLRHEQSHVRPLSDNLHQPVCVDSQLVAMEAGLKSNLQEAVTAQGARGFGGTDGHIEMDLCRRLCEDGVISDAVDSLNSLVQEGCRVPKNLLYRVLKRCIQSKNLALGRRIHAITLKSGLDGDAFLATHLINLYSSHGSLDEAMAVFAKVTTPDAYNWATIILAYARHGAASKAAVAIRLYRRMCESTTIRPDERLYAAVLRACATAKDVVAGKEVHSRVVASLGDPDRFVQAGLVNMYVKCGCVEDARKLFDGLPNKNVVTWTAMIAGYAQKGMGREALSLYSRMQQQGLTPDSVTYVCMLKACAIVGADALREGNQLHAQLKEQGLEEDMVVGGSLVNMYVKCGSLENARNIFDELPKKNIVAWTAMIAGYAQQGLGHQALSLYSRMQQYGLTPDSVTYACLLHACAHVGAGARHEGTQLHAQIKQQGLEKDAVLGGSLVSMYVRCCGLEDARILFDELSEKNVVAWTSMIAGYAQHGIGHEALRLYRSMQEQDLSPDAFTYVCLLQACSTIGVSALAEGQQLHADVEGRGLEQDVVVGRSLVNMYAKCGSLEYARRIFDKLLDRDVITWTAMIAGYAQEGRGEEALSLYTSMQQDGLRPNTVTYICLLQACASVGVGGLRQGQQLHIQIEEQGQGEDTVLGGSLVNMYVKCGSLESARKLFDKLSDRNVVAWTGMIAGYAQQGMCQEALSLYSIMQDEGHIPNSVTYTCLLQACAAVAALQLGEQLHAQIRKNGMQDDALVGAALVNMYAKCGSMYNSQQVFDSLPERSVEAWGALIGGYAHQGDGQIVFDLLDRMIMDGVQPDEITFLTVLTACSHVGSVGKGRTYFTTMKTEYGISATMEHYVCMVDLLGRAGHLEEALQMAKEMPFSPNDVLWLTLLGACRKWKNVGIGQQAFEAAIGVDGKNAAAYVLMSNIYASTKMWEAAKELKLRRMKLGAWKKPGQSWWTDMGGVVHTFLVGDQRHPESESIYCRLEQLISSITKEGYVPYLESSLFDGPSEKKLTELCGHSEKLAIAYALTKTAEGTTIRIVKNLRICEDCHAATAFTSKVEKRIIICRDAARFHVFKDGKCSCGDYW